MKFCGECGTPLSRSNTSGSPGGVRAPEEFEPSFRKMTPARADALLVVQEALFASHFSRLDDLSKKRRLPTMCGP